MLRRILIPTLLLLIANGAQAALVQYEITGQTQATLNSSNFFPSVNFSILFTIDDSQLDQMSDPNRGVSAAELRN